MMFFKAQLGLEDFAALSSFNTVPWPPVAINIYLMSTGNLI